LTEHQPSFGKTPRRESKVAARSADRAMKGFWHRPHLMNLVSDVLILLASVALGYSGVKAAVRMPVFGLQEVVVVSPLGHVTPAQIEYAASSSLRGNFFTVDLEQARKAFESLPWVRKAQLRRQWPARVEVSLEEHEAVAYWHSVDSSDTRLVNTFGELFDAASNADMPVFSGPPDAGVTMISERKRFDEILRPIGRKASALTLSSRHAWQLKMDDGVLVELGRDQSDASLEARLGRFVTYWPQASQRFKNPVVVADLRYPSGFSVRTVGGEQDKGKK
jgi:cell division protein FtsQ